jgi:hypothetical protein
MLGGPDPKGFSFSISPTTTTTTYLRFPTRLPAKPPASRTSRVAKLRRAPVSGTATRRGSPRGDEVARGSDTVGYVILRGHPGAAAYAELKRPTRSSGTTSCRPMAPTANRPGGTRSVRSASAQHRRLVSGECAASMVARYSTGRETDVPRCQMPEAGENQWHTSTPGRRRTSSRKFPCA